MADIKLMRALLKSCDDGDGIFNPLFEEILFEEGKKWASSTSEEIRDGKGRDSKGTLIFSCYLYLFFRLERFRSLIDEDKKYCVPEDTWKGIGEYYGNLNIDIFKELTGVYNDIQSEIQRFKAIISDSSVFTDRCKEERYTGVPCLIDYKSISIDLDELCHHSISG